MQEGQEGQPFHVFDKDGIELESVPGQPQAEELAEPIGGYVIHGGQQTTDSEGNVLRVGGTTVADFRGTDEPVDAAEALSEEDKARLLAQQNRQQGSPSAPSATTVQVVGGADLGVMAACILGGLAARPDFEPGATDDMAVNLAVNLAQKIRQHPAVATQTMAAAAAPGRSIFNSAQANTVTAADGSKLFVPPKRVKLVKGKRTLWVDPNSPEGKEALAQQAQREVRGRPSTDY